ncbi:MAG: molybdopterin-dependent oxidoreductase [Candidatus Binatus sp.]|uniref:molybdopterin-dependent oxidoreductase n=1 Tax=Candidatus Binatus sp. TaxID=2811406 RepID=UPI00271A8E88|nr:molybdopterin-dependent oxidoreductase [Candidatus Binatus sp.]MDO8434284.1 molybdopterin-dependent oxidoreductase [Candidatus Binatus sp.]
MAKHDTEGEWIKGWPDRKRAMLVEGKDQQGRTILARSPALELEGLITPTDLSYIVAQLDMPEPIHPDDWSLSISGEVEKPLELSFRDLRNLPSRTVRAVTECAGNDAEFFSYLRDEGRRKPERFDERDFSEIAKELAKLGQNKGASMSMDIAIPTSGYASGGEFTGVSLRDVLKEVGLKPEAVAIRAQGFDTGKPDPMLVYLSAGRRDFKVEEPGLINYDKGLPVKKALDPDTILAWAHNGEMLQHVHGAPVRLVVPGWSGNWWVKWLEKLEVMNRMPDCYYQTQYFVMADSPDSPKREPCTALGVKSVITTPREGELTRGKHAIRGLAWGGEGGIVRVEVSTDGGASWREATIEEPREKWLWVRFYAPWEVEQPGRYSIMARATDEHGRLQPQIPWNFQRKHFDGIVPVEVEVK